jgi:hypothetical protein
MIEVTEEARLLGKFRVRGQGKEKTLRNTEILVAGRRGRTNKEDGDGPIRQKQGKPKATGNMAIKEKGFKEGNCPQSQMSQIDQR